MEGPASLPDSHRRQMFDLANSAVHNANLVGLTGRQRRISRSGGKERQNTILTAFWRDLRVF